MSGSVRPPPLNRASGVLLGSARGSAPRSTAAACRSLCEGGFKGGARSVVWRSCGGPSQTYGSEDLAGAVPHLQAFERGSRVSGGQPPTQQPGDGGPLQNNDADPG